MARHALSGVVDRLHDGDTLEIADDLQDLYVQRFLQPHTIPPSHRQRKAAAAAGGRWIETSLYPDGDGLIEVSTLAQLNATCHDRDGDGAIDGCVNGAIYRTDFFLKSFLPWDDRNGYELTANLNFAGSEWGKNGSVSGIWQLIGDDANRFNATFEGERPSSPPLHWPLQKWLSCRFVWCCG